MGNVGVGVVGGVLFGMFIGLLFFVLVVGFFFGGFFGVLFVGLDKMGIDVEFCDWVKSMVFVGKFVVVVYVMKIIEDKFVVVFVLY